MPAEPRALRTPHAWTPAKLLLAGVLGAAVLATWGLHLSGRELLPTPAGLDLALRFLGRALSPALSYEGGRPPGAPPFLAVVAAAAGRTLVFAAGAVSLALALGLPLGLLAASSWWLRPADPRSGPARRWGRAAGLALYATSRVVATLLRSVHELLWAVLFLAALGRSSFAAVLAIALPYAGTFAKVFSEILDETPAEAAEALEAAGASRLQAFLFGLLPRALPDLGTYAFYRFECAVRSSAVLGFFGFPTLGYFLAASFENLHYAEVWSYLYAIFLLVVGLDAWSSRLRRRVVG